MEKQMIKIIVDRDQFKICQWAGFNYHQEKYFQRWFQNSEQKEKENTWKVIEKNLKAKIVRLVE